MSSAYNLEPPTKGKVLLKTSLGDLEVELWAKEAPKACRNFVQLCLEGYYDNTIFHRIIKDYLIQGGDPTGQGEGGETVYGDLFKDEFHSRLKFTHRGLLACANQNRPNSNGSQFFITLDKTDWLDKKNTIFGKVVGDTIYNLLRMGDLPVDETDRPLEPPVLREVEVVWNPFDDIVPRRDGKAIREAEKQRQEDTAAAAAAAKKSRAATGRSLKLGLLSFGDEAEEELGVGAPAQAGGIRSAHDALQDRRLAREEETPDEERIRLDRSGRSARQKKEDEEEDVRALARTKARLAAAAPSGEGAEDGPRQEGDGRSFGAAMHQQMQERRKQLGLATERPTRAADEAAPGPSSGTVDRDGQPRSEGRQGSEGRGQSLPGGDGSDDNEGGSDGEGAREQTEERRGGSYRQLREERNDKIEQLRMETKRQGIGRMAATDEVADANLLKPWQLAREQYKQKKKLVGSREKATLERLAKFSQTLKTSSNSAAAKTSATAEPKSKPLIDYGSEDDEAPEPSSAVEAERGYSGKVRTDIDHKEYLPAAWRVDDYLDREDLDTSLDDLRSHTLKFSKDGAGRVDAMARNMHDNDYYVVIDPLLEKGMGTFSKAEQGKKKRQMDWGQRDGKSKR